RPTRNEGKPSRPARGARQQIDASGRLSLRVFLMRAILVALALPLAACLPSGAERWKVRVQPGRERRRIDGVFFSPDASLVVTTGHEAQTLEVWDAATGRSIAVLDIARSRGVAFHPSERVLAVAGAATIHVVDVDRGQVVRTLPNAHAGDAIFAIAFSADGQTLATISGE